MKSSSEEGDRQKNRKLIVTDPDWLDLPEPVVTNIILEHLEVVDYIRFSAVCKKWHSIQKEHRISYSPHPPPLPLPFPWLICNNCSREYKNNVTIVFHLLDKQRTYEIPIFKTPIIGYEWDYVHGWLILFINVDDIYKSLWIVNPVTGVQIELPPFLEMTCIFYISQISSPPTDPDCTILVMDHIGKAYLYRLNNNSGWKTVKCSTSFDCSAIFCNSKIYHMNDCRRLCIVDTLPSYLVEQTVEMDCSEICEALRIKMFNLVDFFGELVMVIIEYEGSIEDEFDIIKEFHVYKADFSTNKWVKMKSLGEYALFFSSGSTFPLLANDVGCKKNTIYTAEGFLDRVAWRAFNLSTKDWIDGPSSSLTCDYHLTRSCSWFLPTLDSFCLRER